ncbi:hypothetical protein M9194_19685 [Vibrio sp. S4M6]|uniref:hypothetical protein n=1 Tax=Vibrio sinus TaxID=2946865 RepID=UPI002029C72A|nr:hypothetical protein [Vibrio sinus]MCL9783650.1 hypothetical protein [Vibrio sinus]
MNNTVKQFEAVLNTQAHALEVMMTNQPTTTPRLMEEAIQLMEESVCKAIQAAKQVEHTA